jgi:hypothetical protein
MSKRTSVHTPNAKGNLYAITSLKHRRATMAGEIEQFKEGIRYREEQLSHLDAVLRELDPSYRAETIAPKKLRRVHLFGKGELNRLILDALRRGGEQAMKPGQIAETIIEVQGYGEEAKPALIRRVRANLGYLQRQRGLVDKIGHRWTARWKLRPDTAGPLWECRSNNRLRIV